MRNLERKEAIGYAIVSILAIVTGVCGALAVNYVL